MEEKTLDALVRAYKELLDKKEELADLTKANNKALHEREQQLAQTMVDMEKSQTMVDGFNYSLQVKTIYSKKSEEDLAVLWTEQNISFFESLRNNGLGDIIVEKVDPRTLSSSIKNLVEECGGDFEDIPDDLRDCLNVYEEMKISKRKANTKALDKAKNL